MSIEVIHDPEFIGKNLQRLRSASERTLRDAAERAGISKAFLSLVENGKRRVKAPELRKILNVYNYSVGRFISEALFDVEDELNFIQQRKDFILLEGDLNKSVYHILLLRPVLHKHDIELLEIYLPPDTELNYKLSISAEIRGIMKSGSMLIDFTNDENVANEGDEFSFDGKIPHIYRNHTANPATANLIIYPPMF